MRTPETELSRPKSVVILGMGASCQEYLLQSMDRGREALGDEVWGINCIGNIVRCDKIFLMDTVGSLVSVPRFNFLDGTKIPTYTSIVPENIDGNFIEYPLGEIVNHFRNNYFNNTVPYTIAYALWLGVEKISLYGVDYTYEDLKLVETGRGCTEFWLGIAFNLGVELEVAGSSTLLGVASKKFYGYDREVLIQSNPETSRLDISFGDKR